MRWRVAFISTPRSGNSCPIAILFYTACLVHVMLGLWAMYERRQFRWKAIEPLQLVLGLTVPALVVAHVVGVRLGQALHGHEILYPQVLFAYWIAWPAYRLWLMIAVSTWPGSMAASGCISGCG